MSAVHGLRRPTAAHSTAKSCRVHCETWREVTAEIRSPDDEWSCLSLEGGRGERRRAGVMFQARLNLCAAMLPTWRKKIVKFIRSVNGMVCRIVHASDDQHHHQRLPTPIQLYSPDTSSSSDIFLSGVLFYLCAHHFFLGGGRGAAFFEPMRTSHATWRGRRASRRRPAGPSRCGSRSRLARDVRPGGQPRARSAPQRGVVVTPSCTREDMITYRTGR